jgi:hypothetical protein
MTNFAAPMVMPRVPALMEVLDKNVPRPLSQVLRADTELAHKDVERRLGLPGSIADLPDYCRCLLRFYQLYHPLEAQFERFPDWAAIGLDPPSRHSSPAWPQTCGRAPSRSRIFEMHPRHRSASRLDTPIPRCGA